MTSSNSVGCSTGRFAGLARGLVPLRAQAREPGLNPELGTPDQTDRRAGGWLEALAGVAHRSLMSGNRLRRGGLSWLSFIEFTTCTMR